MPPLSFDPGAPSLPLALWLGDQPLSTESTEQTTGDASTLQPGAPAGQAPTTRPAPGWAQTIYQMLPIIVIGLLFYFLIVGGSRKREKQRQALISTLSRGDRVTTIGGIIGSVVDSTGDEVVLKVDENTNTKIRIIRSAVASVVKPDSGAKKS